MSRIGVFGRSGSGKSWFLGWLLERVIPKFDYAAHFDLHDEEEGLSMKDESLLKTFYVDKEFLHKTVEYQGREMSLAKAVVLKNKKVRVVPDGLTDTETAELFNDVASLAMKIGETEASFHLSADEAHEVVPNIGDNLEADFPGIERVLTGGRKRGVEWLLCTQRPAKLHEDAYTQMNMAAYFSLTKDNDINKVNGSSGFSAHKYLPELQPREYILEDLDEGSIAKQNTNNLDREHPHYGDDDGIADDVMKQSVEGGKELSDSLA
jgi:hypothetical protein